VTAPAGVTFPTACTSGNLMAATASVPSIKTCTASYTLQPADVGATPKALTFTITHTTLEAGKLQNALPATVPLNIPTTTLVTSFTTADCVGPFLPTEGKCFGACVAGSAFSVRI
jgi:hypothetical protein